MYAVSIHRANEINFKSPGRIGTTRGNSVLPIIQLSPWILLGCINQLIKVISVHSRLGYFYVEIHTIILFCGISIDEGPLCHALYNSSSLYSVKMGRILHNITLVESFYTQNYWQYVTSCLPPSRSKITAKFILLKWWDMRMFELQTSAIVYLVCLCLGLKLH